MKSGLLFLLFVILALAFGCPFNWDNQSVGSERKESLANLTLACVNKLNLDATILNSGLFKNEEADDKCLAKCLFQQLEFISDSKVFDRDAFFELLEEQAPKSMLIKLTEIVNKCADSTQVDALQSEPKKGKVYAPGADSTPEMVTGPGSCKAYHAFLVCFSTNAEKLC